MNDFTLMTYLDNNNYTPVHKFENDKFKMLLADYPQWEASISSVESDIWIKVIPKVNIPRRLIYYPDQNKKTKKTSDIVTNDSISKLPGIDEAIQIDDFFNSIPVEIIAAASKFSDSHWEIVKAIKLIGKDLLLLINNNPALAYTIVNIEKINHSFTCFTDIDVLHRMIRKRHKEILGLIGFPESERMTRIFAKIIPSSINVKNIIALKNSLLIKPVITDEILKILSFSKSIDNNLLRLVSSSYPIINHMTHKVIFDLVNSTNFTEQLKSLFEIISCSKQLEQNIPQIVSISSINKINSELKQKLRATIKRNSTFPSAPKTGNEYIQPIKDETELKLWALKQQNCIASYSDKIHSHKCYLYRVIYANEEATLEITLKNHKFRINTLLGKSNRKVSPQLRKVVNQWLKK